MPIVREHDWLSKLLSVGGGVMGTEWALTFGD